MKLLQVFILFLLIPFAVLARVPDNELIPLENRRVIDNTNSLQSYEITQLTSLSEEIEHKSGAQYVIVLVESTEPYTIEDYAFSLGEYWQLGTKGADNGIVLLIALKDKRMRIEVGYGLEGAVPDALTKRIIETQLKPNFKNQAYFDGIFLASTTLKQLIFKEPVTDKNFKKQERKANYNMWIFMFPFLMIVLVILKNRYGQYKGLGVGLGVVFIVSLLLAGLGFAVLYIIILAIVTIFSKNSGNNNGGGHYHGGYGGGFGGFSGGGGGGGGGGFSGGGGSFGGGGASGNW